ncbi:hypothetical protein, partial [Pseudomonas cichorii]|uniref:hypothetical protein n=1 Tax=Pseudomonas cichorii TaxID=36746 RepID=UPI001C7E7D67
MVERGVEFTGTGGEVGEVANATEQGVGLLFQSILEGRGKAVAHSAEQAAGPGFLLGQPDAGLLILPIDDQQMGHDRL